MEWAENIIIYRMCSRKCFIVNALFVSNQERAKKVSCLG